MENGVEALKIASSVLIFVLAITITISTFTTASQAINSIFSAHDADEYVKGEDGKYLNFVELKLDGGTRKVGIETVIPSIYRAYKENYAIYFYNYDGTPLEIIKTKKGRETTNVHYIDLEQEVHASAEKAIENINYLLYEDERPLYSILKQYTFIEKLGEYYMDDVSGENGTAEVNKTKKRIITYTAVNT